MQAAQNFYSQRTHDENISISVPGVKRERELSLALKILSVGSIPLISRIIQNSRRAITTPATKGENPSKEGSVPSPDTPKIQPPPNIAPRDQS